MVYACIHEFNGDNDFIIFMSQLPNGMQARGGGGAKCAMMVDSLFGLKEYIWIS